MPNTTTITSKLQLRPAQLNDIEKICELGINTFSATFGYSLSVEDLNDYLGIAYNKESIGAELVNPAMTTIVVENPAQPTEIIGFGQLLRYSSDSEPCLQNIENPIELHRLYVNTKCHSRGVGSQLMKKLECIAKDEGFKSMWLGVWEENGVAKDFYRNKGFERVGEHAFRMGNCVQIDWILCKRI